MSTYGTALNLKKKNLSVLAHNWIIDHSKERHGLFPAPVSQLNKLRKCKHIPLEVNFLSRQDCQILPLIYHPGKENTPYT